MLNGKKILLGITGSIAAYKAAHLVRLFVQQGAIVRVIMTPDSKEFITPLSLATLSKHAVHSEFIENKEQGIWTNHVELGLWADVFLIAPATANTIAKMANGICDNLLLATYLSAKCPVFLAPAMDLDMWAHPVTQNNIKQVEDFGNQVIDVEEGELASGLVGKGRMAEPETIVEQICFFFDNTEQPQDYNKKKVLITAGPTQENIDPVRFITNHSTGTMGVAIANEFAQRGADVDLILGPTQKKFNLHPNIRVHNVVSAQNMFDAVNERFDDSDISVMTAAVADYKPEKESDQKIKKSDDDLSLTLERTKDILGTMGQRKKDNQIVIGFALETNNELENAKKKLHKKNLDFIVLNSLNDTGAGFKHDTNQITIIDKNDKVTNFDLKSKKEVAKDIVNYIPNVQ